MGKFSILWRIFYRGLAASMLCAMAFPGFVSALPLVIAFRVIRRRKVRAGFFRNYDEVAQTKMVAIFLMVPLLTVSYAFAMAHRWSRWHGKVFAAVFPALLWLTMRWS